MSSFEDLPAEVQDYVSKNRDDGTWRGPFPDFACEVCSYSSWEEFHSRDNREAYRCLVCNNVGTLTVGDDGDVREFGGCITDRIRLDGWECAECGDNDWLVTDRPVPRKYDRRYKHYTEGYKCLSCGAEGYHVWDSRKYSRTDSRWRMHGPITRAEAD